MSVKQFLLITASVLFLNSCVKTYSTDVLVIGGSTSGTSAAIAAARQDVEVIVVEPTPMLGGMLTAQGVSATDGNYELRTGIWREFQDSLFTWYGGPNALRTGWVSLMQFEPHVADRVFKNILAKEPTAQAIYGYHLESVIMAGDLVKGAYFVNEEGRHIHVKAKVTIDATDLGDALPMTGTPYSLGMDSRADTGEPQAAEKALPVVQDLTLVGILKDYGPDADMTIPEPAGFDRAEFDGLNVNSAGTPLPMEKVLTYGKLPGGKYMLNWPGKHGNDTYLEISELSWKDRQAALQEAREKTLRFIYYIQTVLGKRNLGIADDEFDTHDGLAYLPYNREGRRMKGAVVMTLNDIVDRYSNNRYRAAISVGNYPVDHHHGQYSEPIDIDFPKVPSFSVSTGVMVPRHTEGLVVSDKAISVTNLANGSTRLQPVVLATGQAAGTLAALAVQCGCKVREVPVRMLQTALLDAGCYLQPLYDVAYDDPDFGSIHRVASTGILRMTGEPYHWANRTWFYPDQELSMDELRQGLEDFYGIEGAVEAERQLSEYLREGVTRREAAILIDDVLNPFAKDVDYEGNLVN